MITYKNKETDTIELFKIIILKIKREYNTNFNNNEIFIKINFINYLVLKWVFTYIK